MSYLYVNTSYMRFTHALHLQAADIPEFEAKIQDFNGTASTLSERAKNVEVNLNAAIAVLLADKRKRKVLDRKT